MNYKVSPLQIKRVKQFSIPILVALIGVVLSLTVLVPQVKILIADFGSLADLESKKIILDNKVKILTQYENNQVEKDFKSAEYALPSQKNVPFIVRSIKSAQAKSGVVVEQFSFKPGLLETPLPQDTKSKVAEVLSPIEMNIQIYGSQGGVLDFIDALLSTTPVYRIKNANFTRVVNTIKSSLSVTTYSLSLPSSLGTIDTPLPEINQGQKAALDLVSAFDVPESEFPVDLTQTLNEELNPEAGTGTDIRSIFSQ